MIESTASTKDGVKARDDVEEELYRDTWALAAGQVHVRAVEDDIWDQALGDGFDER